MSVTNKNSQGQDLCKRDKTFQVSKQRALRPANAGEITAKLSVCFSLDAASRFSTIWLHPDSYRLGVTVLAFGITGAPEIFQPNMLESLDGLEGMEVLMHDILIYGTSTEQRDAWLEKVMQCVKSAGWMLNKESQLLFLGQHMTGQGLGQTMTKWKPLNPCRRPVSWR